MDLPFIDEHSVPVGTPSDTVWNALLDVLWTTMRGNTWFSRLLGTEPRRGTGEFTGEPGQAIPGFVVAEAEPGRRLVLRGRHRFAIYQLTATYDGADLTATTHADFPGLRGKLYRAAVIGTPAHSVVTQRMLRKVARRALRASGKDAEAATDSPDRPATS